MRKQGITKTQMAERMNTSRDQIDRILKAKGNVTIETLQRAAALVGRELRLELVVYKTLVVPFAVIFAPSLFVPLPDHIPALRPSFRQLLHEAPSKGWGTRRFAASSVYGPALPEAVPIPTLFQNGPPDLPSLKPHPEANRRPAGPRRRQSLAWSRLTLAVDGRKIRDLYRTIRETGHDVKSPTHSLDGCA